MSGFQPGADPLRSWSRLVRRRWRTGAVVVAMVTALGAALLFLSKPVHRTEAALRLGQPPPPGGVSPAGGILSFFQLGGDPFANDLELLGSRSVAEAVVERAALTATLDAPRLWHRDSLVTVLETTRETREASFEVTWAEDGSIGVVRTAPRDSAVARVAPGERVRFGGLTVAFVPWRAGMPREIGIVTAPFAEAVRRTRSTLVMERPRREANVVALSYDHVDPGVSTGVVAAAIEEFVRLRTVLHTRESGETSDSLRVVARRTAEELRQAEAALERVQREGRIVAPDAQSEALVERQTEMLLRLQRGRAELTGVDEMLGRLDQVTEPGRSWTALLSYPAFLENQTLGEILARLTELHGEREALASRRTETNRELRVLDERIDYLDRSLRQVAREYRAGLVEQIAVLEPEIAALDAVLAELPAKAGELGRRQRDVRLLTEILVLTEQRLRQEELREALTYSNVQVVDPPALRDRPVWPRKKLGLAVVLLLASGTGLMAMVVRERTDGRLRSGSRIREILDAPLLAVVRRDVEGGLAFSRAEAEAVGRRAAGGRLVLATAGDPAVADEVAQALRAAADGEGSARAAGEGPGDGETRRLHHAGNGAPHEGHDGDGGRPPAGAREGNLTSARDGAPAGTAPRRLATLSPASRGRSGAAPGAAAGDPSAAAGDPATAPGAPAAAPGDPSAVGPAGAGGLVNPGGTAGDRGIARPGSLASAGRIRTSTAAAEVAAQGAAVAVVVEVGRTRADELLRLRHVLHEAQVPVSGLVFVCPRAADEEAVWE